MPVQAVVLDLFHTLVNPEEFKSQAPRRLERVAERLGSDATSFIAYWRSNAYVRNRSRTPVIHWVEEFMRTTGRAVTPETLHDIDHDLGCCEDSTLLNPPEESLATLQDLRARGLRLGLLSNADEREVRSWPSSPLSLHIDAARFSFEIGHEKPEPQAYAAILADLGVSAARAVFVGDGGSNELAGAREAGFGLVVSMQGFIIKSGLRPPEKIRQLSQFAHATITSIDALPDLIQ